jgi:DNA-directed RNA polymerase sigma subunit (sigma70/sigma32)
LEVIEAMRREALEKALMRLDERERGILARRHGLHGEKPETARRIAADLGISNQRVSDLQKRAEAEISRGRYAHILRPSPEIPPQQRSALAS